MIDVAYQDLIIGAVQKRWDSSGEDIETRAGILKYMSQSPAIHSFTQIIADGLDDYTTNARGDVGSLVRIEAASAAGAIWKDVNSSVSKVL